MAFFLSFSNSFKLWQSKHLQSLVQYILPEKHSQYNFKHLDFLQLQGFLGSFFWDLNTTLDAFAGKRKEAACVVCWREDAGTTGSVLALGEKMSLLFTSLKLLGIKNTEEDAFDSLSPSKWPFGRILFLYLCVCVILKRETPRRRERESRTSKEETVRNFASYLQN